MKGIDELIPLRHQGRLVKSLVWPATEETDPPRALRGLARIIDGNLCHRCGSCVGICPTGVLGVDKEEYPIVKNLSACTDCDLCTRVCPGAEFSADKISEQLFGYVPERSNMHGHFSSAFLAYATDSAIREVSSSGGFVTGLLVSLLEAGAIDGALVVSSDDQALWKGKPLIARTKEEILLSTKSKYAISPTNVMLEEIRKTPGRYAVVGLPCQIHGLRKAMELDARIRERVVLSIGLFCHAAIEHEPMEIVWEMLGDRGKNARRFLSRVGKHPGTPFLEMADGSLQPVYYPWAKGYRPSSTEMLNVFYRLYTPLRCFSCYDSSAEFADIAVGDPWMSPPADDICFQDGYSFILVRTEAGKRCLEQAKERGDIFLYSLSKQLAMSCNTLMGKEKRLRAFRIIDKLRRREAPAPVYGFSIPSPSGRHAWGTRINLLTHCLCFAEKIRFRRARTLLLRVALSPLGYVLLWLNFQKRQFRDWRRDRRAKKQSSSS